MPGARCGGCHLLSQGVLEDRPAWPNCIEASDACTSFGRSFTNRHCCVVASAVRGCTASFAMLGPMGTEGRTGLEDRGEGLVAAVLAGDRTARHRFVVQLSPVVRHRVARVMLHMARGNAHQHTRRQDVLDLIQDVFLVLLRDNGKVLASWSGTEGLSLHNFVGLVAEREAAAILRSGRRSAWAEEPTDDVCETSVFANGYDSPTPEGQAGARQELELLFAFVSERLSPRALELFRALFVNNEPLEDICARFAMTSTSVYTFRSRVRALVAQWHDEVSSLPAPVDASTFGTLRLTHSLAAGGNS
jgi:DNA-directed RNA polymerase specialized sigma24 family protein